MVGSDWDTRQRVRDLVGGMDLADGKKRRKRSGSDQALPMKTGLPSRVVASKIEFHCGFSWRWKEREKNIRGSSKNLVWMASRQPFASRFPMIARGSSAVPIDLCYYLPFPGPLG